MRRILKFIAVIAAIMTLSFAPVGVFADDACKIAGESDPLICGTPDGGDEEVELMNRVSNVLNVVYLWIGIIAVVFIVIGGIKYMTSAGDTSKVEGAKKTITFSVIGLVVVLAAFAITSFIIGALDGRNPNAGEMAGSEENANISFGEDRYKVRSITAIKNTNLVAGQESTIKARVIPDYAKNKTLNYTSSNPDVVSVDKDGKIKAKKEGTATITIESPDGAKKDVTVKVVKPIPVTAIKLSETKVSIEKGKSKTVTATPIPSNAANKNLTWQSANTQIATVSQSGTIKGIKDGETTVTVSAFNQEVFASNTGIVLAAENNPALGTTITSKIKVTVSSDPYETVGDQRNVKYSKRLDFRPETRKIINKHNKDFNYTNDKSKLKSYGGYKKYLKNELGGVFKLFADEDRIKVKTAADFQAASEYVFGLWAIWGIDYGNGDANKDHHSWTGTDAFYYGQPGREYQYGYCAAAINEMLTSCQNIRTNCNTAISTFAKSTKLRVFGFSQAEKMAAASKVGKIRYADELQVGDVVHYFNDSGGWHHVAMVGEVYKDYIVFYDGGGRMQKKPLFKQLVKRTHTKSLSPVYKDKNWYGVRVWNIDQSKTLKGLN